MAYRETPYVRKKKAEKRQRILAAAEEAFAEKGVSATSTRELIQRSGVSTTAFYAHFPQKEDVLNALITEISTELKAAVQRAMAAGSDPFARLYRSFLETCQVYKAHKALAKIMLGDVIFAAGPAGDQARALYRDLAGLAIHEFQRLQEKGRIGNVIDVNAFAYGMLGAVHFQLLRWAVWGEISGEELEKLIVETGRMIVGGIQLTSGMDVPRRGLPANAPRPPINTEAPAQAPVLAPVPAPAASSKPRPRTKAEGARPRSSSK